MKLHMIRQYGFNLLESILVLGLITIFSIGAYFLYNKIVEFYLIHKEVSNMKQILNDSEIYITTPNKLFLSPKLFAQLSVIGKNEITNEPHPYYINSFSTRSDFSPIFSSNDRKVTHLKVTYLNMTGQFCARLVTKYEPDADFISIGNDVLKNKYDINNNVDYHQEQAISSCAKMEGTQTDFPMIVSFRYQ